MQLASIHFSLWLVQLMVRLLSSLWPHERLCGGAACYRPDANLDRGKTGGGEVALSPPPSVEDCTDCAAICRMAAARAAG